MKNGCASPAPSSENPSVADLLKRVIDMIADAVVERLKRAEEPRLLTIREAARELRRSERWVRLEIAAGRLEVVRRGKSRPRVAREALNRYIERYQGRD